MSERDLYHSEVSGKVLAAAFEVHKTLGPGFLESVYEQALASELTANGVEIKRQVSIPIHYKGVLVGTHVLDLLVENSVVVELKAIRDLAEIHSGIALSYLAATKLQLAMILNFGKKSLEHKRVVR